MSLTREQLIEIIIEQHQTISSALEDITQLRKETGKLIKEKKHFFRL